MRGFELFDSGEGKGIRALLSVSPPARQECHGFMDRTFAPGAVRRLRPEVATVARRLLTPLLKGQGVSVITRVTCPLPMVIVSSVLKMPDRSEGVFGR